MEENLKLRPTRIRDIIMKIYTCPKCGNVITNSESLYACPKCGCSADSFIVTDKEETTSNNYNVSDYEQYKKESGIDQPVLSAKDYDVICPDCNSVIADESSDCSICGCPSNLFIKRAKTKFVYGEKLECPDCGKVFTEIIPAECPNCGCPSDKFKQHIEENTHQNSSTQNKNAFSAIFITLFIVGILGGFGYLAYSKVQEAAEQARQEQYQKEQQAQREREEMRKKQEEERQAKEAYNALKIKWKDFSGTTYRASHFTSEGYQYYAFSYNSAGKGKYIIWWNYPGTNVVEEQMEFSIYKVESDANYLYLYTNELNTPVKIKIEGRSLYTSNGEERYEVW